jgi:HEAT repeat protein
MSNYDEAARAALASQTDSWQALAVKKALSDLRARGGPPTHDELAYLASSTAPAAWQYLTELGEQPERHFDLAVALDMARFGEPIRREALLLAKRLLASNDSGVRMVAMGALGNVGTQAALDLLVALPDGDNVPAQVPAIVRCIPASKDFEALHSRVAHWLKPTGVHQVHAHDVIRALGPHGERHLPKLRALQKGAKPTTAAGRHTAIHTAITLHCLTRDPELYAEILAALGDKKDAAVRTIARLALLEMGPGIAKDIERVKREGNALQRVGADEILREWVRRRALAKNPPPPGAKQVSRPKAKRPSPPRRVARPKPGSRGR